MFASQLLSAFDENRQIAPLSEASTLTLAQGYGIAAQIAELRQTRGERIVGRKIGFTNRTIWPIYNVDRPVWGWIWETSLHDIPKDGVVTLPARPELRLEPEIIFGLAKKPEPDMTPDQLLRCIDWVSHGIELVMSAYPGWQFTAPDSAANQAMHAALWVGPRVPAGSLSAAQLEDFSLRLTGPDTTLEGHATDVLGGPLHALSHLLRHIADMPGAEPPQPGEVITTGTLTDAVLVTPGQHWQTQITGLALPGLDLHLV